MKKGFTLVELITVIIILGIISIITVPIIINIIEKTKIKTSEVSAINYVKALETQIIVNDDIVDGNYYIDELKVNYSGKGPTEGYLKIEDGTVLEAKFCINKYSIYYNEKESKKVNENYCMSEYNILLKLNNEKIEEQTLKRKKTTTFDININMDNITNVSCNNEAIPIIKDNKLIVNNIYGNTTCILSDSIKNNIDNFDNTINNVVLLNDSRTEKIQIPKNKNIILDLNGYSLDSTGVDITDINYTNDYKVFNVMGKLVINDNKKTGSIKTGYTSRAIDVYTNGSVTINGGSYTGRQAICQSGDNSYLEINDGNFSSKVYEVIKLNDKIKNIKTIINGGNFISNIESSSIINIEALESSIIDINGGTFNSTFFRNITTASENRATININGGEFTAKENSISHEGGILNIKDAKIISKSSNSELMTSAINTSSTLNVYDNVYIEGMSGIKILPKTNFNVNINGSTIIGNDYNAVQINSDNSTGNLNINGGTIISKKGFAVTNNSPNFIININQVNNHLYISSQALTFSPAISNQSSSVINIKGKEANECTNNPILTTSGLCIYSEGNKEYSKNSASCGVRNNSNGVININGGTIYGGHQAINNSKDGIINISNGKFVSGYYGILNNSSGTINVCKANIISSIPFSNSDGYIYYDSNTKYNGTFVGNTSNIVLNNLLKCQ